MRFTAVSIVAGMGMLATPSSAAWNSYISHPLGFSYEAPGEVAAEKGVYETPVAGRCETIVFRSTEDGIAYTVTVIDVRERDVNAANIHGEAAVLFQNGKILRLDAAARVDRQFGRKLTVDLPNDGGREMAAYYFIRGRLIELKASVPAGGDTESPDLGRFVDSVAFFTVRARPDSTELTLPD